MGIALSNSSYLRIFRSHRSPSAAQSHNFFEITNGGIHAKLDPNADGPVLFAQFHTSSGNISIEGLESVEGPLVAIRASSFHVISIAIERRDLFG